MAVIDVNPSSSSLRVKIAKALHTVLCVFCRFRTFICLADRSTELRSMGAGTNGAEGMSSATQEAMWYTSQ